MIPFFFSFSFLLLSCFYAPSISISMPPSPSPTAILNLYILLLLQHVVHVNFPLNFLPVAGAKQIVKRFWNERKAREDHRGPLTEIGTRWNSLNHALHIYWNYCSHWCHIGYFTLYICACVWYIIHAELTSRLLLPPISPNWIMQRFNFLLKPSIRSGPPPLLKRPTKKQGQKQRQQPFRRTKFHIIWIQNFDIIIKRYKIWGSFILPNSKGKNACSIRSTFRLFSLSEHTNKIKKKCRKGK